ncbi:MAG: hypothetical protein PF694_03970 [Bacteroidetes bacterium]|jgi:hypothetical protein|nr:hypothetical protein [Bacteroidota bacterium]
MDDQKQQLEPGNTYFLRFDKDKAFLADRALTFSQIGLATTLKSFETKACWRIRVTKLNPATQCLHAEILSYFSEISEIDELPDEITNTALNRVESMRFKHIDTDRMLKSATAGRMPRVSFTKLPGSDTDMDETSDRSSVSEPEEVKPAYQIIQKQFKVPINQLRFQLGAVSFTRQFSFYDQAVDFLITNFELREEFDAVKNYFSNVLKTREINVIAKMEINGGELTVLEVQSPEISKIDKKLIESVRFEFVAGMKRKKFMVDVDQSLFTMEELLDKFGAEGFRSNTFYQNEQDLMADLLQITDTKHYRNLRYLSSVHAHHIMKLRFVHKPFSFVFLVEGEKQYHLIWETLDTEEATYIWHCDKNLPALKQSVRKLDDILNVIKAQGKIAYLNTSDDPFRRVYHDYSDLVDGFVKWKAELEQYLS